MTSSIVGGLAGSRVRAQDITVAAIVDMVTEGLIVDTVIENYPDLEPEDLEQALHYAAEAVREGELSLRAVP